MSRDSQRQVRFVGRAARRHLRPGAWRARAFAYTGDVTASGPGCLANVGLWNHLNAQTGDSAAECASMPEKTSAAQRVALQR